MRFLQVALLASSMAGKIVESEAGLTGSRKPIACLYGTGALDADTAKWRVLIAGGLDGVSAGAREALAWFETAPGANRFRPRLAIAAIPEANPGGVRLVFPPPGGAYAANPESHYLWRFIGSYGPDLVIIAGEDPGGLAAALEREEAAGMGRIPVRRVEAKPGFLETALREWLPKAKPSPARIELRSRMNRTPRELAEQLAIPYGHELPEAVYIPAFALIGRLRLGAMSDVESIVEPYASGRRNSLAKATASHLAGHLVFGELARRTSNRRYLELVKAAADMGFDEQGRMRESMPMHGGMSDSVFMGCPILAMAGRLTGESGYFDMCLRHMKFMEKLDLRPDGLYRHSPLDETAWGRGNAFAILGLALSLSEFPASRPGFAGMKEAYRNLATALRGHQEPSGMWRQVVDYPGAYRELSATCMIATAMLRGIRRGWIPRNAFQPVVDRAWRAAKLRIAADGGLIDVCTGTGKQKSLADYLDRAAILGPDPRGGAMALLFASEMAGLP